MLYRRHRRRRFPVAEAERSFRFAPLIALVVAAVIVFYLGAKILDYFGVGNSVRQAAVTLDMDDRAVINVSLDGNPMKRADSSIKLYPGDTIESTSGNRASVLFFDGTIARMEENSRIRIVESEQGEEESQIVFNLEQGSAWILTPEVTDYSGSIVRTVGTNDMELTLSADAELLLTSDTLTVFSSEGLGIGVHVDGLDDQLYIGEGQQFILPPEGDRTGNLTAYRQAIDPEKIDADFVSESRKETATSGSAIAENSTASGTELLNVLEPLDDAEVTGSTVIVRGTYGPGIERVRINGYMATLDEEDFTFSQELTLPDEDSISISIEAVDETGIVAAEAERTVTRNREAPAGPAITKPAATGTTYKTNNEELTIEGTAPAGTVGIIVNDYRLQLFESGDTEWSYLAAVRLENLKKGENIFNVYSIGANGERSAPSTITIVIGDGNQGVVSSAAPGTGGSTSSEPEQVDESTLPTNAPTKPGTLSVEKPGAGNAYTTSEKDLLIEGKVDPSADSVWVNGYKLRLYTPGKTFWNYIANAELGTLKPGKNEYKVNARDKNGNIIDSMTYTITYNP